MDDNKDVPVSPDATPERAEPLNNNAAPAETAPATPARKRPIKILIAALIAAIIIALIGGSVFGYTMWYQNPDKVVHDAILNAIKAKTVSSTGTITYDSNDITMDISLESKSGKGDGEFAVTAKGTIESDQTHQDFEATGTGKIIDDTLYVKLEGVKNIVEDTALQSGGKIPNYAPSIFEKIENRWISIKASDTQALSEEIASQQTCFLNLMDELQSDSSMANEVADLYKDNQIVVIDEELGTKDVNNVNSLGYKVSVDKEAADRFIAGLEETNFGQEVKNCNQNIDFNKIANDIDQEAAASENPPVTELWVSSVGHDITEIAIYGSTNDKGSLNIILQPIFDKNVTVDPPEDVTPFRTVLGEIQQTITEYQSGSPAPMPESVQLQSAV